MAMAATPERTASLLDDVLAQLSTLPGRRTLTATVLVSQPRKKAAATVFPYAPKIDDVQAVEQDVLLLIAENQTTRQTQDLPQSDTDTATTPSPGAYVAAIEANLYIFPTTHSVIVYISKVDTTGQGQRPSPTRAATVALLEHIVRRWFAGGPPSGRSPGWNVWVHLFARAQNQYLFPASIEHPGKKVLSDAGLVRWWKAVMDDFVSACTTDGKRSGGGRLRVEPHVSLPGATDDEAMHLLKVPLRKPETTTGHDWRYGHPYSGLLLSSSSSPSPSLAKFPLLSRCSPPSILELIPYFPDDPKSRFIAELMDSHTTVSGTVIPPPAKRRRMDEQGTSQPAGNDESANLASHNDSPWADPLGSVSIEEFWERMAFRQECSLGAVVAFFVVYVHTSPVAQLTGAAGPPASSTHPPPPTRLELPPGQVVGLLAKLNSLDFGTTEKAVQSTELLQQSIRAAARGYVVLASGLPGQGDEGAVLLSGGGADTGQDEAELFARCISRSVELDNPDLPAGRRAQAAPAVTVLTARKKKKVS